MHIKISIYIPKANVIKYILSSIKFILYARNKLLIDYTQSTMHMKICIVVDVLFTNILFNNILFLYFIVCI